MKLWMGNYGVVEKDNMKIVIELGKGVHIVLWTPTGYRAKAKVGDKIMLFTEVEVERV